MKKLLHLLLLLFCFTFELQAQNILLKVGGGLSSHYKSSRPVGSFKAGIGFEYEFGQHWGFEPSLIFYAKGWKDKDQTVVYRDNHDEVVLDEDGNVRTGIKNVSSSANYIELPLVMHYYLRTGVSRYVIFSAGPYVAYGIAGKMNVRGDTDRPGSEKFYYSQKTFDEPGVHRWDAGAQLGIAYQFNRNMSVGVETDLGLTKFNSASMRNVSGLVTLTWKFTAAE